MPSSFFPLPFRLRSETVFEDLAGRFERPDAKNRWDAPLFTVCPAGSQYDPSHTSPEAAATAVQRQLSDIIFAMLDARPETASATVTADTATGAGAYERGMGDAGAPTAAAPTLTPNLSTYVPQAAAPNLLHDVDRATQDVITAVNDAQASAGGVGGAFQGK